MNLKQLRYFLGVLEAGSFTRAAETLRVAQPAIGVQIRQLEADLGVELFVRHSRGVAPTEAGEVLAQLAEGIIEKAEQMRRDIMEMGREPRGPIALGLTGTAARALGARLLRVCHGKYPDLELTVTEAMSHRLTAWLGHGELDMAVTCAPPGSVGVVSETLAAEPLHFVAPPGHPLGNGPDIPLRVALDADLVLPPRSSAVHRLLAEAARASGAELRVARTVESVTITKDLVRDGFACAVMPYGAVRREIEDGSLTAPRIVDPHLARTLYLTCAQDRMGAKAVQAVCEEIRAIAAELLASGAAGWTPWAASADTLPVDGKPLDPRIGRLVRLMARQAARDTIDACRNQPRPARKVKPTARNKGVPQ